MTTPSFSRPKTERRILLVGDQPLLLDALARLLESQGFVIVGEVGSTAAALGFLYEQPAEVVVDLSVSDGDKPEFIQTLRRSHPDTAVVVVPDSPDESAIKATLDDGAAACVRRDADPRDLVTAIRQVFDRSLFFQLRAASRGREAPLPPAVRLTARELEILQLVADGASNAAVAKRLWVTEQTVKFHLSNIFRKFGVSDRTEASRYAQLHGLLRELPPTGRRGPRSPAASSGTSGASGP